MLPLAMVGAAVAALVTARKRERMNRKPIPPVVLPAHDMKINIDNRATGPGSVVLQMDQWAPLRILFYDKHRTYVKTFWPSITPVYQRVFIEPNDGRPVLVIPVTVSWGDCPVVQKYYLSD